MSDGDRLKVCIVCGDCYTLTDVCSRCRQQQVYDKDRFDEKPIAMKYHCLQCRAGVDSLDIACPNCGYELPSSFDIPF